MSDAAAAEPSASATDEGTKPRAGWPVRWGVMVAAIAILLGAAIVAQRILATPVIDGIGCVPSTGTVPPLHQHLVIEDVGKPVIVPGGIGVYTGHPIAPCLYWLHTHAPDGIIHVESPTRRIYTLGQFFALWRQPLGRRQVLSLRANPIHQIKVYVNGRLYRGDPRALPLTQHAVITLEYGPPWVLPPRYNFQ